MSLGHIYTWIQEVLKIYFDDWDTFVGSQIGGVSSYSAQISLQQDQIDICVRTITGNDCVVSHQYVISSLRDYYFVRNDLHDLYIQLKDANGLISNST